MAENTGEPDSSWTCACAGLNSAHSYGSEGFRCAGDVLTSTDISGDATSDNTTLNVPVGTPRIEYDTPAPAAEPIVYQGKDGEIYMHGYKDGVTYMQGKLDAAENQARTDVDVNAIIQMGLDGIKNWEDLYNTTRDERDAAQQQVAQLEAERDQALGYYEASAEEARVAIHQLAKLAEAFERACPVAWICPECGPFIKVDEDGCCASCGADAVVRDYVENLATLESLDSTTDYDKHRRRGT